MNFVYNGKEYEYFYHGYNQTKNNERCVEVAVARHWMLEHRNEPILEVGSVMPMYFPCPKDHVVVDLFDCPPTITIRKECACDIDYTDVNLLSVSTIEHVKAGEIWNGQQTLKVPNAAYELLERMINESKTAFITWALGVHADLDRLFSENKDKFNYRIMARESHHVWTEVDDSWLFDTAKHRYGLYHPGGTAIVIVEK